MTKLKKSQGIKDKEIIANLMVEINKLKYQVNRLKKYDEERDIKLHNRLIVQTRIDTANEFANMLKTRKFAVLKSVFEPNYVLNYKSTNVVFESDIDEVLKSICNS